MSFKATKNRYTLQIVFCLPPAPRLSALFRLCSVILVGATGAWGQNPAPVAKELAPVVLPELPERFFQVQDSAGFLWQALDNGALISGETQYLQSGLNLIVDGEPFAPSKGSMREPGLGASKIDVALKEERGAYTLSRDFWFDTRRSGVRVLDSFVNTGNSPRTLSVVLRTTYPFAWQSLHGTGGAVLGTEPALSLRSTDVSLGVHFSPSEGRHDTFFLFGSEKGGLRPQLKASANSRELVFLYEFELKSGETKHLVHWILQRNLPDVAQDLAALAPFLQGGQWVDAGVSAEFQGRMVNLASASFAPETNSPGRLRTLSALQNFTDALGYRRQNSDLLWSGPNSQLAGELQREGTLEIDTVNGPAKFPVAMLAAVRGGAGQGLIPQWYLRDGRVLLGSLSNGVLSWKGPSVSENGAEFIALDLAGLNVLLLRAAPEDGNPPAGTTHFLQSSGGAVIAVAATNENSIRWLGPAGEEKVAWDEVSDLARRSSGAPGWRVLRKDASTYPLILAPGPMTVPAATGDSIELVAAQVERIWRVDSNPVLETITGPEWVDFTEIPPGAGPASGLLLRGRQVFAGALAEGSLVFRDGNSLIKIDSSRVERIQRSGDPESQEVFVVGLNGGEELKVEIPLPYLALESAGRKLEFPIGLVMAYRKPAAP